MGSLEPAIIDLTNGIQPGGMGERGGGGQSIVFTTDPKITLKENDKIYYCGGGECDG